MIKAPSPVVVTAALSIIAVAAYFVVRSLGDDEAGPGAAAPTALPELVERLPDFVLDDLGGVPTSITSWPGKPLVVNFWATWCAPCLREIPMLMAFQDEHAELKVVGIAVDRVEPVRAFAEDMQFNYPVLVGPAAMDAAAAFGVGYVALPLTVFVGADADVLGAHLGELHPEHLENLEHVLADLERGTIDTAEARARLDLRR